jgi:class 3 adenylate cyclase
LSDTPPKGDKEKETEKEKDPITTPLADAIARYIFQPSWSAHAHTSALSEALKSLEAPSRYWAELTRSIDWGSQARLQAEALQALDLTWKVQRQADALKAVNWDPDLLPGLLGVPHVTKDSPPPSPLEAEMRDLREKVSTLSQELNVKAANAADQNKRIKQLQATLDELKQRENLAFLLNQVHPGAQPLLEQDEAFRNNFLRSTHCHGFVMSVDIRRSTDLMLKARTPEQFATFIRVLCSRLTAVVFDSFGVFDKFTGDGVLAFFPDFYSGGDAGYHALAAAERFHAVFDTHYRVHRNAFVSVLKDIGLGIGIDYGKLHLVQVAGALTVVGAPVVYACRLGGAPAGSTLINQPAFEQLSEQYGPFFSFEETDQELKHEGKILAYRARRTGREYDPKPPDWFKPSQAAKSPSA